MIENTVVRARIDAAHASGSDDRAIYYHGDTFRLKRRI